MSELLHSRYRLVEVLGSGAMGVVWRAEDTVLEREIALKELGSIPGIDPTEAKERFLVEARAAARLSHPNIVAVHDVFSDDDRVRIAMELVAGPTIAEVVRTSGAQPADVVRAVMAQVAQALAAAHRAGVVHRDLKPENVFWTAEGRAVVADFGLARIGAGRGTVEGTVMGTPGYMAPEQVKGEIAGPTADVFGWGAVAYELASGIPPFGEPSVTDPGALSYRIVHEPPPPLNLPDDTALADLINRALAKNPADRPQDGSALVAQMTIGTGSSPNAEATGPLAAVAPLPAGSVEALATTEPPSVAATPSGTPAEITDRAPKKRRPPSGAVFLLPALVLLGLIIVIAFNGGGTRHASGTVPPGTVTINGKDPAGPRELLLDMTKPVTLMGKIEPGFLRQIRFEFSAIGIPLGSHSRQTSAAEDGTFRLRLDASDAAKFFVGGRVTARLTFYGPEDEFGVPAKMLVSFPLKSTQSSLRTVPAGVAAVMILFLLAYVKSSLYWMIYGERKGFETTNLIIGGAFVGIAVVLLSWLFGGPEPTGRVLIVCVVLGMGFGVATAVAAFRFSQRRASKATSG